MRRPIAALSLGLLLTSTAARAHDADLVYARISRTDGAVEERVTLALGALSLLVPLAQWPALSQAELDGHRAALDAGLWDAMPLSSGAVPCARGATVATLRDGYVELTARFACPQGELSQTFRLLSVLPSNYRVVLGTEDGAGGQRFAQGNEQTLFIPEPGAAASAREEAPSGLAGWVVLGMKHIFTGYDHLCFLLALLLVGGTWKRVLGMVTSFTVAHSITLGATALGWVALDPSRQRFVEMAIAASIIYVAAENLVRREHRHRVWVTFAFGLVHGFGFASVLTSYGLGSSVALALLGFNAGVEVGQGCVVAVLFPLVRLLQRRQALGAWATRVASVAILAAGGFWLVDRALG